MSSPKAPDDTDPDEPAAAKPDPDPDPGPGPGPREIGGPKGPEPTRYGDWEHKGIATDF